MAEALFWRSSTWTDAGQLVNFIDPDRDSAAAAGRSLPDWFADLRDRGENADAILFLAHALPRYECVVWAAQSLLETNRVDRADPMMTGVLRWIDDPDDEVRRSVGAAADAMSRTDAMKLLGHAVFFSGGSIAPPELAAVQPPANACPRLAAGAVLVASYSQPDALAVQSHALALGERMVSGG